MNKALPNVAFWSGRRVLLTGHTGFKGAWMTLLLNQLGAEIHGFSIGVPTNPSFYDAAQTYGLLASDLRGNVADFSFTSEVFSMVKPQIVLHFAAQPLVLAGHDDPRGTFSTNTMGTVNVLEASLKAKCVETIIVATTDKVYKNRETRHPYSECDELGGSDPYSASKAAAELVAAAYRGLAKRPATKIATVRAGNVIGGGDWSPTRLLPDLFAAMDTASPIEIRNPNATRPWQHVLDPLIGYLLLAETSFDSIDPSFPASWNFGPSESSVKSVRKVIQEVERMSGRDVPTLLASNPVPEHQLLALDSGQAKSLLGWHPRWSFEDSIRATVRWHDRFLQGHDMNQVSNEQIETYMDGRHPV